MSVNLIQIQHKSWGMILILDKVRCYFHNFGRAPKLEPSCDTCGSVYAEIH